jgi:hypothetical protein
MQTPDSAWKFLWSYSSSYSNPVYWKFANFYTQMSEGNTLKVYSQKDIPGFIDLVHRPEF